MQLTIQDGGYKNRRRGGNSAMSILPWGGGGGVECASVSKKGVLYQWCGICYVFLKVHSRFI